MREAARDVQFVPPHRTGRRPLTDRSTSAATAVCELTAHGFCRSPPSASFREFNLRRDSNCIARGFPRPRIPLRDDVDVARGWIDDQRLRVARSVRLTEGNRGDSRYVDVRVTRIQLYGGLRDAAHRIGRPNLVVVARVGDVDAMRPPTRSNSALRICAPRPYIAWLFVPAQLDFQFIRV